MYFPCNGGIPKLKSESDVQDIKHPLRVPQTGTDLYPPIHLQSAMWCPCSSCVRLTPGSHISFPNEKWAKQWTVIHTHLLSDDGVLNTALQECSLQSILSLDKWSHRTSTVSLLVPPLGNSLTEVPHTVQCLWSEEYRTEILHPVTR